MNQPIFEFDLKLGESKVFTGKTDESYTLSVHTFGEHDHRSKPLYYYHPEEISENDPNQVVICIEDDLLDDSYTSPYAGTIEGSFDLFRREYLFACDLNSDRIVHVGVYELNKPENSNENGKGVFSSKNRQITWPFKKSTEQQ